MNKNEQVYKNQTYSRLCEHVIFENEISKSRGDYESLLFTILSPDIFSDQEKEEIVSFVDDKVDFQSLTSLSNVKLVSLYYSICDDLSLTVNNGIKDTLNSLLDSLSESSAYPGTSKSFICWILRSCIEFRAQLNKIESDLAFNSNEHQSKFQYLDAIELGFGVSDASCFETIINNPNQFLAQSESWPRDKIAKSIITLSRVPNFDTSGLVKLLELKIEEELSSWIEPDIWLAVIESEKVINSNIPPDEISIILNNLSNKNSSWAKLVSNINEDGVHLRLNSVIKSPAFSPIEDTLSLIALKISERENVIQLTKNEYVRLSQFSELKDLIPFSRKNLYWYLALIATVSFAIGLLLFSIIENIDLRVVSNYFELALNGEIGTLISNFDYKLILFTFFIWWIYRLISLPSQLNRVEIRSLLLSIPILSAVLKKFIK